MRPESKLQKTTLETDTLPTRGTMDLKREMLLSEHQGTVYNDIDNNT